MVYNSHQREIAAARGDVGVLIDSLASKHDRLWPRGNWPAMRLDRPLSVDASGGHGPVRYFVAAYEPGRRIEFQFTGPKGFVGRHSFVATSITEGATLLHHELFLTPRGIARITWPLFFRPLHDALIEESLDRAQRETGTAPTKPHRRSAWTRLLRATFSARMPRRSER